MRHFLSSCSVLAIPLVISSGAALEPLPSKSWPGAAGTLTGAPRAQLLFLLRSVLQPGCSTFPCLRFHWSFLLLCPVCCVVHSVNYSCASFPLMKKIFCNIIAKSFSENPATWVSCSLLRWLFFLWRSRSLLLLLCVCHHLYRAPGIIYSDQWGPPGRLTFPPIRHGGW